MTRVSQRSTGSGPDTRPVSGTSPRPAASRGAHGISVQKYGGSSLATADQMRQVARTVADTHRSGRPTVVVVSASGHRTDELLRLAAATGQECTGRETDQLLATGEIESAVLLAITLQDLGVPAVSLTGAQAGIRSVGKPGEGVIAQIDTRRLQQILAEGAVPVVAGFQGGDGAGDVITLGRGGSDTTAVALAAVLGADCCEICTDVAGVATADPRVVDNVRVLPVVDVQVMAEMSFAGARVLHSRAVELAAMHGVELQVRSSQAGTSKAAGSRGSGTVIPAGGAGVVLESQGVVVAVAHDLDVVRVLVQCGSRRGDLAAEILVLLSERAVPVDLVARSGPYEDEFRMGFTMRGKDVDQTLHTVREAMAGLGTTIHVDENVGKLSLIGMGLLNRPEYSARMLTALAAAGIPTSWLSTSQIRTSVVIPRERVLDAVQLLHEEFGLGGGQLDPVAVTPV